MAQRINPSQKSVTASTVSNSSQINLTNTSQDLAGNGVSITVDLPYASVVQVSIDMGCRSTSDFEFIPQLRVNGAVIRAYNISAAAAAGNRASYRGFTQIINLVAGSNVISAGVQISSGTTPLIAANGAQITVVVLGSQ